MFMQLISVTNHLLNFGIIALHEVNPSSNCKIYIKVNPREIIQETYVDTTPSGCNLR